MTVVRWFALLLLGLTLTATAHPVSQGSLVVVATPTRVEVHARVSVEEAFLVEGFSSGPPAAPDAIWRKHGLYLAEHLHIEADGVPLRGELFQIGPPVSTAPSAGIAYDLVYPIPPEGEKPLEITLRQDLLNEFEFAPGNPWEVTFVVTIGQQDRTPKSVDLFTRKDVLSLPCDWGATTAHAGPVAIDRARMFGQYLRHGVEHILRGYDHLLFMAGLVLAVVSFLDLVKVVSAFTLAHTVTLTLSVLNIVHLPAHIVEPMIAASIVFVALQNIFWPEQSRGWTRLAVAFGFGLFHGLGFAGGLLEAMAGLPGVAVATAIVAFSIGVELGHQVVVLPLFAVLRPLRQRATSRGAGVPLAVRLASGVVSFAGMYYLVVALR